MAIDPELDEILRSERQPWWRIAVNMVPAFVFVVGLSRLESGSLGERFVIPVTVATIAGLVTMGWSLWRQSRQQDEFAGAIQREAAQVGFWALMALLAITNFGQAVGWIGATIDGDSPTSFAFFIGLFAYAFGHFRAWRRRVGA